MSGYIYLNNAATSYPKPRCVPEAVAAALEGLPGAMGRGGLKDVDIFDEVRRELAPVLGVSQPRRIALGPNATWGLNQAIFGCGLQAGDCVITTKAEHNSVLRPLYLLRRQGVRVIYLDVDAQGRVPLPAWTAALRAHRPRLAVFSHASNVTGAVSDAAAMIAAARAVDCPVLLDASQTAGWLPVQAEAWGADMAAFTGHKYLLGPQGTGGLWVRPGLELTARLVGGTGIHSDLETMPPEMPQRLEAGTGGEPAYHGLLAALGWARAHPPDQAACDRRLEALTEGLRRAGAEVIVPDGPRTPVVSFTLPGYTAADAGYILRESYDVLCRTGLHCAPKIFPCLGKPETVRLSLSRFTTDEEIEAVVSAVEDMAG